MARRAPQTLALLDVAAPPESKHTRVAEPEQTLRRELDPLARLRHDRCAIAYTAVAFLGFTAVTASS